MPLLTVCWKAAMPFASICLRFELLSFTLDPEFVLLNRVELRLADSPSRLTHGGDGTAWQRSS